MTKRMPKITPLRLARLFHEADMRLAPGFGVHLKVDTFKPTSPDGLLLRAICKDILERLRVEQKAK
jgi:hypothetical protein